MRRLAHTPRPVASSPATISPATISPATSPARRLAAGLVIAVALLLLAGLGAAPAAAGEIALFGAYWDTSELDESAGLGAKLSLGDGLIGFEARVSRFPELGEDFEELVRFDFDDLEIEATPIDAGLQLRFNRGGRAEFFVSGGGTYFLLDSERFGIDDEVGYYVGAGVTVGGGSFAFFAEALYREVEGTVVGDFEIDDIIIDERIDLDLGGPALHLGAALRF